MSVAINIAIDPAGRRLLAAMPGLAARILERVRREMDEQNQLSIGEITVKRLSFPKEGPTVLDGLRVHTNRLRGSLYATPAVNDGQNVFSAIGSNVKYAAIHEFGGRTRPRVIKPRNAQALAFFIGGRKVFARSVQHPGSQMPARRYVSGVLEERAGAYVQAFSSGIADEFQRLGNGGVA